MSHRTSRLSIVSNNPRHFTSTRVLTGSQSTVDGTLCIMVSGEILQDLIMH